MTDQLLSIILVAIITIILTLYIKKWWNAILSTKRFRRGNKAERKAKKLLKRNGFKILQEQYPLKQHVHLDDQILKIDLQVDYLAEKKKRKYLIEVKSGKSATKVTNSATRRQLLEYYHLNPFDGLLLVDMETKRIHTIEFPSLEE